MNYKKGIAFSPLSERVYMGKMNREKGTFIGERTDVTQDFYMALFGFLPAGTMRVIGSGTPGTEKYKENLVMNIGTDPKSVMKAIKSLNDYITENFGTDEISKAALEVTSEKEVKNGLFLL